MKEPRNTDNTKPRPDVIGLIGLMSLKLASLSKPSKDQYTDDEIDQLISGIRYGKA